MRSLVIISTRKKHLNQTRKNDRKTNFTWNKMSLKVSRVDSNVEKLKHHLSTRRHELTASRCSGFLRRKRRKTPFWSSCLTSFFLSGLLLISILIFFRVNRNKQKSAAVRDAPTQEVSVKNTQQSRFRSAASK